MAPTKRCLSVSKPTGRTITDALERRLVVVFKNERSVEVIINKKILSDKLIKITTVCYGRVIQQISE